MNGQNEDVLIGREDYLFLKNGGQHQFDYLTGRQSPSKKSIENFASNLRFRHEYCKNIGVDFRHVVFPSKPLIKINYLPLEFANVKSLFRSCYSDFFHDVINGPIVFYPLQNLIDLENKHSTFYKSDTHMTARACHEISCILLESIGVIPDELKEHEFVYKEFLGDLGNMSNSERYSYEEFYVEVRDLYSVENRNFIKGNTNNVSIFHNYNNGVNKRLLVFGDSFIKDCLSFMAPYFKDILYVRSSCFQPEIIAMYRPDVIFSGNAERYLSDVESDNNAGNFLLSLYGCNIFSPSNQYREAFSAQMSYAFIPACYNSWVSKICRLNILDLDDVILQNHITEQVGEGGNGYIITGHDPQLVFNDLSFRPRDYLLSLKLTSDVSSTFQVFYTDRGDVSEVFSEKNSIKYEISIGINNILILLDSKYLGSMLRIDPLMCCGVILITDLSLTVV